MFIAYTDASIQKRSSFLSFVIEFENGDIIKRRIAINKQKTHIAEALAVKEILAFLQYYRIESGVILTDNKATINSITHDKEGIFQGVNENVQEMGIKILHIPRRYNIAHDIAYCDTFVPSVKLSEIRRDYLESLKDYPDYYLDISVYESFRNALPHKNKSFHRYQRSINRKIWLGILIEEDEVSKVFAYYDQRITVVNDTVVSFSFADFVTIIHHYRIMNKKRKLSRAKRRYRGKQLIPLTPRMMMEWNIEIG
ncbi:ribonuclease H family protein [Rossellomorea arthrocnemi]|uniref:hypothetical protein n=1 Tax=Rossellomorea arthrocnemi TaxID=2769542 RepID=UPI00191AAAF3|nr:hypothetical protein [Rossellomorea arthrocnemi]